MGAPPDARWDIDGPMAIADEEESAGASRPAGVASGAPQAPPANGVKKRGRPRGARNKASRLQMMPALLLLRPGDAVKAKVRAYAEKNNVSVAVLSMSGVLQSLPLVDGAGGPGAPGDVLHGPLVVVNLSGVVLRETVDGTAANTIEKTCWISVCCASGSGQCFGCSVRRSDDLVVSQPSILLLATWEPVRMHGVPDGIGSDLLPFADVVQGGPATRSRAASAPTQTGTVYSAPPEGLPGAHAPPHHASSGQPTGGGGGGGGGLARRGDGGGERAAESDYSQPHFAGSDQPDSGSGDHDGAGGHAARAGGVQQPHAGALAPYPAWGGPGDLGGPLPDQFMGLPGAGMQQVSDFQNGQGMAASPMGPGAFGPGMFPPMAAQMMHMGLMNLQQGGLDAFGPGPVPGGMLPFLRMSAQSMGQEGVPGHGAAHFMAGPYLHNSMNPNMQAPPRGVPGGAQPSLQHFAQQFAPPPQDQLPFGGAFQAPPGSAGLVSGHMSAAAAAGFGRDDYPVPLWLPDPVLPQQREGARGPALAELGGRAPTDAALRGGGVHPPRGVAQLAPPLMMPTPHGMAPADAAGASPQPPVNADADGGAAFGSAFAQGRL